MVVVRPARANDAPLLSAFFVRAWKEAGPGALGFTGATDEAIAEISSESFLSMRLKSPNARMVVAEYGGRIIGFASIRAKAAGAGELTGIVVLEGATGKGLGTRLLRKACQAAAKMRHRTLEVKTEVLNRRAIDFYKKNGFTETGRSSVKVGRTTVPVQVLEVKLERKAASRSALLGRPHRR